MTAKTPFRADHVGSLLRPASLAETRRRWKRGEIDAATLRAAEDEAIRKAVAMQESVGLQAATDGEFRRDYWHIDFLSGIEGVGLSTQSSARFQGEAEVPPTMTVAGKLRHTRPIQRDDFAFLKGITKVTAKVCIPAPAMLHLRGGRAAISRDAYPDLDAFWADLTTAYRTEIRTLGAAGCTYLQLDDVTIAYMCDPRMRELSRANGDDPAELPARYVAALNAALVERPANMSVTVHTCRGNFKNSWMAQGGYEPTAELVFGTLAVDGFFLEYDDARSGGFEPLRFVPKGKRVVLGLVSTKTAELESPDSIKRRIDAAAQFAPLDAMCLSPQCGFSSTHHGNNLSEDDQTRKLARVVEVARDVWGTA